MRISLNLHIKLIARTDRFYCHAEPKGEASGFSKRKSIFSLARFFASLRMTRRYISLQIKDLSIIMLVNKSV